jgi:hypothetical protein
MCGCQESIDDSGVETGKKDFEIEKLQSWLSLKKTQTSLESQAQIKMPPEPVHSPQRIVS